MTTIHERLDHAPLDTWSKREQLCLASAVYCSGDQNWINVSRTLKTLCANETRPADWYSQKNCAIQYSYLLQTVESTKRKKRDSGTAGVSSPLPAEPSTELLLKRLTEERINEIKIQMLKDQEECQQIMLEIKALQEDRVSDDELREMWREIESQQEMQRINEMKLENRMREREQRKQEIIVNWRSSPTTKRLNTSTDTTSVDMDVEETVKPNEATLGQQQTQQVPPTSPLLTCLLKSPTTANSTTVASGSMAMTTAPTITTLLTSGNLPNQPAITIRSNVPASETAFITRPISGPPVSDNYTPCTNTGKSPSQSAPTLSMLLEKNKMTGNSNIQAITQQSSTSKQLIKSDTNDDPVPMDIEESTPAVQVITTATVTTTTTTAMTTITSTTTTTDETDPIEEQQLLEVFKNIGNMDDIDIDMADVIDDEEVDFLDDVATSPTETKEVIDFEDKLDEMNREQNVVTENTVKNNLSDIETSKEDVENKTVTKTEVVKTRITSSDDSNDNIPLAEVVSLEGKERSESVSESVLTKDSEIEINNKEIESQQPTDTDIVENVPRTDPYECVANETNPDSTKENKEEENREEQEQVETEKIIKPKLLNENDSSVILVQTDDDKTAIDKPELTINESANKNETEVTKDKEASQPLDIEYLVNETTVQSKEEAKEDTVKSQTTKQQTLTEIVEKPKTPEPLAQPATIVIADTDEDSSMTDVSKEEATVSQKATAATQNYQVTQPTLRIQKLPIEEIKMEADNTVSIGASVVAPTRPPSRRKLRDHDRSESPSLDEDTTISISSSDQLISAASRTRNSLTTTVVDSIPNSPASSEYAEDRRETRGASKKLFLSIYSTLYESRNAVIFRRSFHDEHAQKYCELVLRPMDLPTIRRNIESGNIRNIIELHRDFLLMCYNVIIVYKPNTIQHKTAKAFLQDCQAIKEFTIHDTKQNITKTRGGSRKSLRLI